MDQAITFNLGKVLKFNYLGTKDNVRKQIYVSVSSGSNNPFKLFV